MNIENLPDEVLCQVFNTLFFEDISASNKFKLASVSPQFRRCIFSNFKVAFPLVANFASQLLNGNRIPISRWPQAVEVLVKQAKFSELTIKLDRRGDQDMWNVATDILGILERHDKCTSELRFFSHSQLRAQDSLLLKLILSRAKKLSHVHLGLVYFHNHSAQVTIESLARAFVGKPITALGIETNENTSEILDFFLVAELGNLVDLRLSFAVGRDRIITPFPELLKHLDTGTLKTIEFLKPSLYPTPEMFSEIAKLPTLETCKLDLYVVCPQRVAECVKSYFNNLPADSLQEKSVEMAWDPDRLLAMCQCDLRSLIQDVRVGSVGLVTTAVQTAVGRSIRFTVTFEANNAKVLLSNIWLQVRHDTLQCQSSYNHLLPAFVYETQQDNPATHLHNVYLDRCKIAQFCSDLNLSGLLHPGCQAFSIDINNTGEWVTVDFIRGDDTFSTRVDLCSCFIPNCYDCSVQ